MNIKILFLLTAFALALTGCTNATNTEPANQLKDLTSPQTQTETETQTNNLPNSQDQTQAEAQAQTQNNLNQPETSDWPTYQNTRYQYSIKYPANWFVDTTYSENDFTLRAPAEEHTYVGGDTIWSNYKNPGQYNKANPQPADYKSAGLAIYQVEPQISLVDFINGINFDPACVKTEVVINNITGMQLTCPDPKEIDYPGPGDHVSVFLKIESKVFAFGSFGNSTDILYQMLNTFTLK